MTPTAKVAADYELYDRLAAKRRMVAAELEDDARGARAVSEAALAGKDVILAVRKVLGRTQLQTVAIGLNDAMVKLRDRIVQAEALAHGTTLRSLQFQPGSSVELKSVLADALRRAAVTDVEAHQRRDARQRYEIAMERYLSLRAVALRELYAAGGVEGVVEVQASERAKRELGDLADDLFLPGSPGTMQLVGRERAHAEVAA